MEQTSGLSSKFKVFLMSMGRRLRGLRGKKSRERERGKERDVKEDCGELVYCPINNFSKRVQVSVGSWGQTGVSEAASTECAKAL